MLSLEDWNTRYEQQAGWTMSIRSYLYQKINLSSRHAILDIGCGTGALERELSNQRIYDWTAVDIDFEATRFAKVNTDHLRCVTADAFHLPFPDDHFDVVLCHFLLLWLKEPVAVIREIKRVMAPDGHFLVLAEPDHAARVDWPQEFQNLGELQTAALRGQGADIQAGRQIGKWMNGAGLRVLERGILGGQWHSSEEIESRRLEWKMVQHDLAGQANVNLDDLELRDLETTQAGERVMFIPVFYAHGKK